MNGLKSRTSMFGCVSSAADRGVRVRLLLDDHNTAGLDTVLAARRSASNSKVPVLSPFQM